MELLVGVRGEKKKRGGRRMEEIMKRGVRREGEGGAWKWKEERKSGRRAGGGNEKGARAKRGRA